MVSWLQLIRFDKPIGTWLLWWPTFWALWLASQGQWSWLYVWFALGTFLMRSAGCVMNDIADRNIDRHVTRTQSRPLTSGRVSVMSALALLFLLLLAALKVLLQLNPRCYPFAVFSVLISLGYPLCKRFFPTPQTVLAVAFSMGIPMAFAAFERPLSGDVAILWLINMMWVFAYDTLYACTDLPDDVKLGVHSSARFLGGHLTWVLVCLWISMQCLWLGMAWTHGWGLGFGLFWILGSLQLVFQYQCLQKKEYFRAFLSNHSYGLIMPLSLVLRHGAQALVQ